MCVYIYFTFIENCDKSMENVFDKDTMNLLRSSSVKIDYLLSITIIL